MSKRRILIEPDPILRKKSQKLETVDDGLRRLMDDMLETMYEAPGIGLAAVQIGILKRLVVIDISKEDQTKLSEFSGLMDSIETIVEEKIEEPPQEETPEEIVEIDPQKEEEKLQALQELFSTITHEEEDELREYVKETEPEEKKVEPTNIIEDIV